MGTTGGSIRFQASVTYVATVVVVSFVVLLAIDSVADIDNTERDITLAGIAANGLLWYVLIMIWFRTTVRDGRLRGTTTKGRRRPVRPPALDEIDSVEVVEGLIGRFVAITATTTDDDVVRWHLDAPRTLRWGTDARFDDQVADLRHRIDDARTPPA